MISKDIYIRILEETDIAQTTLWMNDPEISAIMGYLPVQTLSEQLNWFKDLCKDKSRYVFAICKKEGGNQVGNVGLGNIDYINRHCMFNIFIVDKDNRSVGLGTQATLLALDFAFKNLNMNKVYLRTSAKFLEANRLYKKLGFIQEGIMRQHYYTNGIYEDKILYSILKSEYERE
jgi:RimJ/RimL family protein N-acetyltransferase